MTVTAWRWREPRCSSSFSERYRAPQPTGAKSGIVKQAFARILQRRWRRMLWALVPVALGVLHASGVVPLQLLERLEHLVYDVRLRLTLPHTLDERIVIVDIDESSLERVGRWPWSRDKMAAFATELFERQGVSVLGFDVVFAEADDSSGLKSLQQLARGSLKDDAHFAREGTRYRAKGFHEGVFPGK